MTPSARSEVDPFIVMDVARRAAELERDGHRVVHMEIGQPGTPAPEGARRALVRAMEEGPLGYTEGLGLPALRARIARHYGAWHGVDLDPARVVVTGGSSAGFVLAFTALFDAGARVGLGLPGYPSYRAILSALSLRPVGIPLAAPAFRPAPGDLAGLDGMILASPNNPTGTMIGRADLAALMEAGRERGCRIVSDEIYHGLAWGGRGVSALEVGDDAVVVNSFSKYFSMTGWRVGWLVVPPGMVRTFERLAQNLFICASHAGQVAALAAMDCGEELEANVARYRASRALMLDRLPRMGLGRLAPADGAFYAWADVSHLGDSRALAGMILEEAHVAVTPGVDFDPARGGDWLRLSYAGRPEDVAEGLDRLERFLKRRAAA
ncbi:aspartate/methionine/tyrosine aminotransferase [Hasllibacter halocynthiae]|uniref:Aminotransferase n=1 Tax=Hasllibacter halocynthiae TaxID=595589 RepID=A0A2T0X7U7_9RHOB|nr:aminotransferase class I/II-fold pyridoxal phosphate-dependent enzyme [Hasllibacter halocynthiae]PRY94944.1 aspartate/methionine/tyrosine aminotransferase [Hasllibacter halocynthiae]